LPNGEDHGQQSPVVCAPEGELTGFIPEGRTRDNERAIEKDLLGFRLADLVTRPILRGIAFIPLKPFNLRPELGKRAHDWSIRLSYTYRNQSGRLQMFG